VLVTWCLIALIFAVAASLLLAGFLAALDHYCHRRHKPEHSSCGAAPHEERLDDDPVPQ